MLAQRAGGDVGQRVGLERPCQSQSVNLTTITGQPRRSIIEVTEELSFTRSMEL